MNKKEQTSELWGQNGELWHPTSRLPDFSYAGYHHGEKEIPDVQIVKNFVDDYGARAGTDSTKAWLRLEKAVNAGNVKGAIFFPQGVYELRKRIELRQSNVVLRGEEGTILHFPLSLYEVYGPGHRPTPYGYMWYETFLRFIGKDNGYKISDVVTSTLRGGCEVEVACAEDIAPNQLVRLRMWSDSDDPENNTLSKHLYCDFGLEGPVNSMRHKSYMSTYPYDRRSPIDWIVRITDVNGNCLTLERPLPLNVDVNWHPEIWAHVPTVQEVGVENLTFRMGNELLQDDPQVVVQPNTCSGHHKGDSKGCFALSFVRVFHSWMRNVVCEDADNGIVLAGAGFCTIDSCITRDFLRHPDREPEDLNPKKVTGHHPFTISTGPGNTGALELNEEGRPAQDNLLVNCRIENVSTHGVTMEKFTNGNVVSKLYEKNLNFDFHRNGAYSNLYTEISSDQNNGKRLFEHGGSWYQGPTAGGRNTFWNIQMKEPPIAQDEKVKGALNDKFPLGNFVGLGTDWDLEDDDSKGTDQKVFHWIEQMHGANLHPQNLYEAQLNKRLNKG